MNNIFKNIPEDLNDELFESIVEKENLKIERIVSRGHCSEEGFWYEQEQNEWVMLIQGEAEIEFENETVKMGKGDHLLIEAHRQHRVKSTSTKPEAVWLAVHYE